MEPLLVCLIIICLPTFLTGRSKHLSVERYHILFNKELFFEAQVKVFCILFVECVLFIGYITFTYSGCYLITFS